MPPFKKLWCTTWLIWLIWSRCAPIETFILVTTLGHQVLDPGRQWQPTFGQLTTFKTLATFPFPSRPPDLGPFYPGYWHPKCIFSSADGVGVSAHLGPPRQGLWQPRHMNRHFSFYLKKKKTFGMSHGYVAVFCVHHLNPYLQWFWFVIDHGLWGCRAGIHILFVTCYNVYLCDCVIHRKCT